MVDKYHRARKRFGQHFLVDPLILHRIVELIQPRTSDHLLEIGPGQGVLTAPLLAAVGRLDAVELDRDLIKQLQDKFQNSKNFQLHQGDALRFSIESVAGAKEKLRVVGNLPYNISTPLLFHLFESIHCIEDMHFLLQKEVVKRLCATAGDSSYGRLSVMAQYYCMCEEMLEVPPQAFQPPPKVDSAIIRLVPHDNPPVELDDLKAFSKFIALAFSNRRKTLRNVIKPYLGAAEIENCGIDSGRRAETLSLQEFAILYKAST